MAEATTQTERTQPVLALVRDLMFVSKITATARAAGVEVRIIRDPAKIAGHAGSRLLVDLNLDGAMDAAVAWKRAENRPVVGFASHVDGELINRARDMGIDRVLARSGFVAQLPGLLVATDEA